MASWGEWLSSATYSAGESLSTAASNVSSSDTFQQLKEQTLTIAAKVGEVAETTYAVVEETTESAISSASVIAERRLHQTNIALLESDMETAKREWGIASWSAMEEDDIEMVRANYRRTKDLVDEITQRIEDKRAQIAELEAGPAVVQMPSSARVRFGEEERLPTDSTEGVDAERPQPDERPRSVPQEPPEEVGSEPSHTSSVASPPPNDVPLPPEEEKTPVPAVVAVLAPAEVEGTREVAPPALVAPEDQTLEDELAEALDEVELGSPPQDPVAAPVPDHIALANSKPEDELATVSIDDAPAKPPLAGDVS